MDSYFSTLTFRERLLIILAGVIGLLMIGYLTIWEPKSVQLNQLRNNQIPESEQTLAWVKQALANAKKQPNVAKQKIIQGPLLTVIEQTAKTSQVNKTIRRMQPSQDQTVKIWMDEVKFDQWLTWINYLRKQNVYVERASIVNKSPGIVNVRLTLARN